MPYIIIKSAGDEVSFVPFYNHSTNVGHPHQFASELARKVTEAMKCFALFDNDLDKAQAARQALDEKRGVLVTVDSLAIKLTQAVDRHSDEIGEVE